MPARACAISRVSRNSVNSHDKVRVSVRLNGKAHGNKCKLFIVFKGAKRESKFFHKEYKRKCSVATSNNGWINERLTWRWCSDVLGKSSFRKQLLAWDSYEARLTDAVEKTITNSKIETVLCNACGMK